MPAVDQHVHIDATPEQVMAVLTDFRAYPSFLPWVEQAQVLRAGSGSYEVRFTLSLVRQLSYTLHLQAKGNSSLSWSLVEGAFQSNEGGWTLEPSGEGTLAHYRIDVQVGVYVPGAIVRELVDRVLPSTLERFKAEAERRAHEGSAPPGG